MEVTLPLLMGVAISRGLSGESFALQIGLLFAFVVVGYCFAFVCQVNAAKAQAKIGFLLREAVLAKSLTISSKSLDEISKKRAYQCATGDVEKISAAVAMMVRIVPRTPFIALGSVAMLFLLNAKVALLFLLTLPLLAVIIVANTKRLLPQTAKSQRVIEGIASTAGETAGGITQIHASSLEGVIGGELEKKADDLFVVTKKINKINAFFAPLSTLYVNIAVVVVVAFSASLARAGAVDVAFLSTFVTYMLQLGLAVSVLVSVFGILSRGYVSHKRVAEFLNLPDEEDIENVEIDCGFVDNFAGENAIVVKSLCVSVEGFALENISFNLKIGESLGVVGRTGAGKSLLLSALSGMREKDSGRVELFGREISTLSKAQRIYAISVCSQKAVLFSGSIKDNIAMGKDLDTVEVEKVICPFASEKDTGFVLSENGGGLSGGQKQRVALARAVAKNARVLFLDSSFSALDAKTAKDVKAFVFSKAESMVICSQKIADVSACDNILMLDEGKMLGLAPHEELKDACEAYREFCTLQGGTLT